MYYLTHMEGKSSAFDSSSSSTYRLNVLWCLDDDVNECDVYIEHIAQRLVYYWFLQGVYECVICYTVSECAHTSPGDGRI